MTTKMALEKISGNTYPVKDQLKALGAHWNAADKCWEISSDKAGKAREIVTGAGSPARKSFTVQTSWWVTCRCGARARREEICVRCHKLN